MPVLDATPALTLTMCITIASPRITLIIIIYIIIYIQVLMNDSQTCLDLCIVGMFT